MDTFFLGLKKLLVTTMFVVFAFVMIYVPQAPTSSVAEVNATTVFDPRNTAQNLNTTVQSTINAAADTLSTNKELFLDRIGWVLAKQAISGMVRSLTDWVNSGFKDGGPMFITDLGGFLRNEADAAFGEMISELGDVGSFICSPFRLDVEISIQTQYAQFGDGQSAPTCTLTGVIDNIQGFISGVVPGRGLADWLTITATPETYTPYGALLSAQIATRARLINAEGTVLTELNWGSGFLSQSVCQDIEGTSAQDCTILTPGAIIQDALTLNLDSGRQTLVQADEFDELIGALLEQLATKAITGVNGLLGLSSGTGFTYTDYGAGSYLDALEEEAAESVARVTQDGSANLITDGLRAERDYRSTSINQLDKLSAFIGDLRNATGSRERAAIIYEEINGEIFAEVQKSDNIINELTLLMAESDTASPSRQVEIFTEYRNLNITSELRKIQNIADWQRQLSQVGIR